MALHPEIQHKAQSELQAAVGSQRLPGFDDMENLPFVRAILKEVLRWQPVTCLGVPHSSITEDEYRGYRIPPGAIVMGNTWYVLFPTLSCGMELMFCIGPYYTTKNIIQIRIYSNRNVLSKMEN